MSDTSQPPLIVVHHAGCIDGEISRWIVTKALGEGREVKHVAYKHHDTPRSEEKIRNALAERLGAGICIVDMALKKEFLDELMLSGARAIGIFDHHPLDEALRGYAVPAGATASLVLHIDDTKSSNAGMLWKLFFPRVAPPPLVYMCDRMDGNSMGLKTLFDRAASAYIDKYYAERPLKQALQTLDELGTIPFREMVRQGLPLLPEQEKQIQELMSKVSFSKIQILPGMPPVEVPVVHGDVRGFARPVSRQLVLLGQKHAGVAGAWFEREDGRVTFNLRSDGSPDVNKVARYWEAAMGAKGGGHPDCAAAHFASREEFDKHVRLKP